MKFVQVTLGVMIVLTLFGPSFTETSGEAVEKVAIGAARVIASSLPLITYPLKMVAPDFTKPAPNATSFDDKLRHAIFHESQIHEYVYNKIKSVFDNSTQAPTQAPTERPIITIDGLPLKDNDAVVDCLHARLYSGPPSEKCVWLSNKRVLSYELFPNYFKMQAKFQELFPILKAEMSPRKANSSPKKTTTAKPIKTTMKTPTTTTLSPQEVLRRGDIDFASQCFHDRFASLPVATACLNLTKLPTSSATYSEKRRHAEYISLLKKACRRGEGKAYEAPCIDYYTELASDCFFNKVNSPFCKNIAKGPRVRNTPTLKFDGKLHDIYKKVVANFRRTQVKVIECFQYYRNRTVEQCRGLTWNATSLESPRDLAVYAFHQQLIKQESSTSSN